jgi:hypothetical protein
LWTTTKNISADQDMYQYVWLYSCTLTKRLPCLDANAKTSLIWEIMNL